MANPANERGLRDANLAKSAALPNAANTVTTNAIDLGSAEPYPVTERFSVAVTTTAATGANNKNITAVLQESDEPDANFANISELGSLVVTDDNGGGYPAGEMTVQLPPGVKRYVRASATGEANGGNAADGTIEAAALF